MELLTRSRPRSFQANCLKLSGYSPNVFKTAKKNLMTPAYNYLNLSYKEPRQGDVRIFRQKRQKVKNCRARISRKLPYRKKFYNCLKGVALDQTDQTMELCNVIPN